ncbi:type VI secretion system tube protein Hcp [Biformimicrobium ophioploci]|uniref:Uncharacterized protein n=1 Tax=Biformimicrobium ophioploci TaxID=3036711 RepID=A0ABQ6M2K9_9GAMM|nr:type VI secretion system tube protein Hcp [Microbulbifer sp. NKW57]GMG88568.1 hypothetical protein MNKW57_28890 [Microbulbifer sp. NKW57]
MFLNASRALTPVILLVGTLVSAVGARADVFIQIPNIPGEATEQGFEDTIKSSGITGNFAGKSCGNIFAAKGIDLASPLLIAAAVNGDLLPSVTITYRAVSNQVAYSPLVILLENASITAVAADVAAGESEQEEVITLVAGAITIEYQPIDQGVLGPKTISTLNCSKARK